VIKHTNTTASILPHHPTVIYTPHHHINMSDNDTGSATAGNAATSTFTERELQMLGWAMQSLKTGPPEVSNYILAL
jgi:hypothetical protein